jgi:CheY-like chemotaxis protein
VLSFLVENGDDVPDYFLLDIMMSVIDGWEVLDILKEALGMLDLDTNLIFH